MTLWTVSLLNSFLITKLIYPVAFVYINYLIYLFIYFWVRIYKKTAKRRQTSKASKEGEVRQTVQKAL